PIEPVHRQLVSRRSKRLRAALLLLSARLFRDRSEPIAIRAATGIEILHEATLYHDDIVDEGLVRRAAATPYAEFGPRIAAIAGWEFLYEPAAFSAALPPTLRPLPGRTISVICRGQLREIETMGDPPVRFCSRLKIMREKTASLFALCAQIGSVLGGADSQ